MMRAYQKVNATLIGTDGSRTETETVLLTEHELGIFIDDVIVAKTVCTNEYLDELVTGRLLTDGFIQSAKDVSSIRFDKGETRADVILGGSCGCGSDRRSFAKLPKQDYEDDWIFSMAKRLADGTKLHDMTSAAHSCMISRRGDILFVCEDIGRHNAVDKAVGYALREGVLLSECIIYTSGRAPVDMVQKAIVAGIPVMASKASPTKEAVELARRYGLVLIGNARPDSMKLFL